MDNWINILDEDILKTNLHFAAMFVLNYECLKEYVVSQVRDFYSNDIHFEGEKIIASESEDYKREVRTLDKNIVSASLKWFVNTEAISHQDYELFHKIRTRRDDIVHELLKNLNAGFDEDDRLLFSNLMNLYNKIDKWWINDIEIPIAGEDIPEDYDREEVCGGQAIILSIINNIILGNESEKYKNLLEELMKTWGCGNSQ